MTVSRKTPLSFFLLSSYSAGFLLLLLLDEIETSLIVRTWFASIWSLIGIYVFWYHRYGLDLTYSARNVTLLGFILSHILPTFYITYQLHVCPDSSIDLARHGIAPMFPWISLITGAALFLFMFGYDWANNKLQNRQMKLPGTSSWGTYEGGYTIVWIAYTVSWIARLFNLSKGIYYHIMVNYEFMCSQWFSILQRIQSLSLLGVSYVWLGYGLKRVRLSTALLITFMELAWAVPSGSRTKVFFPLVIAIFSLWLARNRPPLKLIFMSFLIVFSTAAIMGRYRMTIMRQGISANTISLEASIAAYEEATNDATLQTSYSGVSLVGVVINRFYDGRWFGYLMQHYREYYDWEYGRTYTMLIPNMLIPYFLWRHSHIMQLPLNDYFIIDNLTTSSCPTTFLGEAYINFGYVGIFVMPLIAGVVICLYDQLYRQYGGNIWGKLLYLYATFIFLFLPNVNLAVWLSSLRNYIIYIYLIIISMYLCRSVSALRKQEYAWRYF